MSIRRRTLPLFAIAAASALALTGCASEGGPSESGAPDDGRLRVVASTNVYGQIVEEIGGDAVEVTSLITSGAQDPHSYEASAQDQLTLSEADLIVANGGGYDSFVDALVESSGTTSPVIEAVTFSHDWPGAEGEAAHDDEHGHDHGEDGHDHAAEDESHAEEGHEGHDHAGHGHIEGFNEHVWYDPHTMEHLAEAIAEELGELEPGRAAEFEANAARFTEEIGELETGLEDIASRHAGTKIFVTEPVPLYLTAAAGLENLTPDAFSEAVEEGQDVPPATLLEAENLLASGEVRLVIVNAQTGGAETTAIVDTANEKGIEVREFTETLPEGKTYVVWMQDNISALVDVLGR